jgi:NADH-quinone oxidoreductase subunit L
MLVPLLVLLIATIGGGYFASNWLDIETQNGYFKNIFTIQNNPAHSIIPLIAVMCGAILAIIGVKKDVALFKNKFYFDKIYDAVIVAPIALMAQIASAFDKYVIDAMLPGGAISLVHYCSGKVKSYHTGYIFDYAYYILLVIVFILVVLI